MAFRKNFSDIDRKKFERKEQRKVREVLQKFFQEKLDFGSKQISKFESIKGVALD
jgi:hypothetical protein